MCSRKAAVWCCLNVFQESCSLFCCLYKSWCHNPVSTVALCFLTQNYHHTSELLPLLYPCAHAHGWSMHWRPKKSQLKCSNQTCQRLNMKCVVRDYYLEPWPWPFLSGDLEVTVDFLTEIDKLVQLIESPIFTCESTPNLRNFASV